MEFEGQAWTPFDEVVAAVPSKFHAVKVRETLMSSSFLRADLLFCVEHEPVFRRSLETGTY